MFADDAAFHFVGVCLDVPFARVMKYKITLFAALIFISEG